MFEILLNVELVDEMSEQDNFCSNLSLCLKTIQKEDIVKFELGDTMTLV